MSKVLLSSFRTAALLTLLFNLVCFLGFLSRALRDCRSLETNKKNQSKAIKQSKSTCIRFPYKPSKQLEELQFSRSVAKKW